MYIGYDTVVACIKGNALWYPAHLLFEGWIAACIQPGAQDVDHKRLSVENKIGDEMSKHRLLKTRSVIIHEKRALNVRLGGLRAMSVEFDLPSWELLVLKVVFSTAVSLPSA